MATAQGTRAFLARHAARHHPALLPRSIADFAVSSLGMGCYRIDASIPDTTEALQEAVRRGVNVLDTSSNYQQEPVGQALQGLLSRGDVQREEVMVMTKVGSIQRDGMEEARLREAEGKAFEDVIKVHSAFWFCMSPEFIRHQLEASEAALGTQPDVVLLHNPEFFLTVARSAGVSPPPHDEFYASLRKAFTCLEELVAEGRIQAYGVSSNTEGCYISASGMRNDYEATSLTAMLQEAQAAAAAVGSAQHHFRVLQVPFNVLEPGGLMMRDADWQTSPTVQCAADNAVSIVGNRPLNSIPPSGFGAGDWGREAEHLKLADTVPMRTSIALLKNLLHDCLQGIEGHNRAMTLSQLALWLSASGPGMSLMLNGARSARYVQDMAHVLQLPPVPQERVRRSVQTIDAAMQELGGGRAQMW